MPQSQKWMDVLPIPSAAETAFEHACARAPAHRSPQMKETVASLAAAAVALARCDKEVGIEGGRLKST